MCLRLLDQESDTRPSGSGGSKGALPARAPLRPKVFSFSCSFWENLAKSYVGTPLSEGWRPLLRGILDLPLSKSAFLNEQFKPVNQYPPDLKNKAERHATIFYKVRNSMPWI